MLALTLAATVLPAAPASADVLVSAPHSSVCQDRHFKVGVWYQSYSGEPRTYRVDVYAPSGRRVLHEQGKARADHWRYWRIEARAGGSYKTVYRSGRSVADPWRAVYRTRSRPC
jgi:hypothetical protein